MKTRNHNGFLLLVTGLMLLFGMLNCYGQFGDQSDDRNEISFYMGFDPKNAIVGGKKLPSGERRNPPGLSFKGGANFHVDYWEFSAYARAFGHVDYYSIGLGLHKELITIPLSGKSIGSSRQTLAFLAGFEGELVWRTIDLDETIHAGLWANDKYDPTQFNYSLSGIIRWDRPFEWPIYVHAQGGWTYRADIREYWGDNSDYQMFKNPFGYIAFGYYLDEFFEWLW